MADKLSVEQQIALILKKAETATPEEAEMLTERAATLMARHSIDMAMLQNKDHTGERPTEKRIWVDGIYVKAWQHLATDIGRYMNVRILWSGTSRGGHVVVLGFKSDIEMFQTMFESLMIQATVAMRVWWKSQYTGDFTGAEAYQARRTFLVGFSNTSSALLNKAQQAAEVEATEAVAGTALVLVSRREEVETFVGKKYPRLRRGRGMKFGGYGAYSDGQAEGRKANVGQRKSVSQ